MQPSAPLRAVSVAMGIAAACALVASAAADVTFSHNPGAVGAAGSAVSLAPDAQDLFATPFPPGGGNILLVNNPAALGLLAGDDIDAIHDAGLRLFGANGLWEPSFVFSVRPGAVGQPGTPVAVEAPSNRADLYLITDPPGHALLFQESAIGLAPAPALDSVDGLALEPGAPFAPGARMHFSLAPGSPTLAANGWSAADVLTAIVGLPGTLQRSIPASQLGLRNTDDLDGLVMYAADDANGDGRLDDPGDMVVVYFSVSGASLGLPGTAVAAEVAGNGARGDVFSSGAAGGNALIVDSVKWTKLAPGDDVDALDVIGIATGGDPFIVAGGVLPLPPIRDPTRQPPIYHGPPAPIGQIWIGICDVALPSEPKIEVILKICDENGGQHMFKVADKLKGLAGGRAAVKANTIAGFLKGITLPKPGGRDVPFFSGVAIVQPPDPAHFPGMPGIVSEVCAVVNQEIVDDGWALDAFCLCMTNWTATIVPGPERNPMGFPDPFWGKIFITMPQPPEQPGTYRIHLGNANIEAPEVFAAEVDFGPGFPPNAILGAIRDQINSVPGGQSRVVGNTMFIARSPVEPVDGPILGPYLYETGAPDNPVPIIIEVRGCDIPASILDFCPADFNLDDVVSVPDIFAFLAAWFAGMPSADMNGDGLVTVPDIFAYLSLWFAGC